MMYNYSNIRRLNTSNENELEYHIYIDDRKWRDLMNNEDLRFFKHSKTMLNNIFKQNNGNILRIGSWDSYQLSKDYKISKKYKHLNLVKYDCYFEYEMDIIHYLCNDDEYPEDDMDDVAVLMKPYLTPLKECNESLLEMGMLLKQIILIVFFMFFKYRVGFHNISLNNISIKKYNKIQNVTYDLGHKCYSIKSRNVVKIDEYRNIEIYNTLTDKEYKKLNENIKDILDQFRIICEICNVKKEITDKESSVNMLNECLKCIENTEFDLI